MKKNHLILLAIISVLVIINGFLTFPYGRGHMDFPCRVNYDENRDCAYSARTNEGANGTFHYPFKKIDNTTKFELYIATFDYHYYGGGCFYTNSNDSRTKVKEYDLDIVTNEDVKINGRKIEKNETIVKMNPFNIDFWSVKITDYKYFGYLRTCEELDQHDFYVLPIQRQVIGGHDGTRFSSIKGIVLLILSIFTLALSLIRIFKKPSRKVRKENKLISILLTIFLTTIMCSLILINIFFTPIFLFNFI